MPRYQPAGEVDDDGLLMLPALGWKKPSANLPLLETSLLPTVNAWPGIRVSSSSLAAAPVPGGIACRCRVRMRRPRRNVWKIGMAALYNDVFVCLRSTSSPLLSLLFREEGSIEDETCRQLALHAGQVKASVKFIQIQRCSRKIQLDMMASPTTLNFS